MVQACVQPHGSRIDLVPPGREETSHGWLVLFITVPRNILSGQCNASVDRDAIGDTPVRAGCLASDEKIDMNSREGMGALRTWKVARV